MSRTQTYFHPLQSKAFRKGWERLQARRRMRKDRQLLIDEYIRAGATPPDCLFDEPEGCVRNPARLHISYDDTQ